MNTEKERPDRHDTVAKFMPLGGHPVSTGWSQRLGLRGDERDGSGGAEVEDQ